MCLFPKLSELLQSFLTHKNYHKLALTLRDALEQLLIDFIDENFIVNIILCLLRLSLCNISHLFPNSVTGQGVHSLLSIVKVLKDCFKFRNFRLCLLLTFCLFPWVCE